MVLWMWIEVCETPVLNYKARNPATLSLELEGMSCFCPFLTEV